MKETPITLEQKLYLAERVGRRIGSVDEAWAVRLAGRFRKKFTQKTATADIKSALEHQRDIFSTACELIPGCVHPPESGEISLADVDQGKLLAGLLAHFPTEDLQVMDELMGWAIFYNYLH